MSDNKMKNEDEDESEKEDVNIYKMRDNNEIGNKE